MLYKVDGKTKVLKDLNYSCNGMLLHGWERQAKLSRDFNLDQQVMALSIENEIYELNLVGALIFELLESGKNCEEIASWLTEKFKIPGPVAYIDVLSFCSSLEKIGILGIL